MYALWITPTTNLIAAYDNEVDALALVLSGIESNGEHDTDTFVLEVENEDGELVYTLQGRELADLAKENHRPPQLAGEQALDPLLLRNLLCS